MSTTKIVGWVLCGLIGLVSLTSYLRLSLRIWLRNLEFRPPPPNVPLYLGKVALGVFGKCLAGYAAILIYDWRFLSWLPVFLIITAVLVSSAIGNLWWEIHYGRKLNQRRERMRHDCGQDSGQRFV